MQSIAGLFAQIAVDHNVWHKQTNPYNQPVKASQASNLQVAIWYKFELSIHGTLICPSRGFNLIMGYNDVELFLSFSAFFFLKLPDILKSVLLTHFGRTIKLAN